MASAQHTAPRTSHLGSGVLWQIAKETVSEWREDKAPRLGAALAYYAVFSLAPMLILALAVAGLFFEPENIQAQLDTQFADLLGREGADGIAALVEGARKPAEGTAATIIGTIALLFGATGVFVQLKDAMNTIWEVQIKKSLGIWGFVRTYILSFAMVLGVGFLLVLLLIVSASLAAVSQFLEDRFSFPQPVLYVVQFAGTVAVVALLFAMIFKFLPDVRIQWRDVWLGAIFTSLLFALGKFAIGMYLGRASFSSSYGAVGTVLVVLVWTYYSAQILFLGAEFTQVYARYFGSRIQPAETAERTG